MNNALSAVVFDMDGVLLDSEAVYEKAWQAVALQMNLSDIDAVHTQVLGMSEEGAMEILSEHYGPSFNGNAFWKETTDWAFAYEAQHGVPVKSGIPEALEYLKRKGYALAVASSSARNIVEANLKSCGLFSYFDVSICGDEVKRAKPAPQIYQTACEHLGVACNLAVAIEDSKSGIESAWRAGLRCIMIPDRIPADRVSIERSWKVCTSAKELISLL